MSYFYLYLVEITILFLLNRAFNNSLLNLIAKNVSNKRIILYIIYIFYWPSIFFHEFAHFLAAKLLFMHIKHVSLVPRLEGDKFQLGYVRFESGGAIRNFVSSSAPFWLGNLALFFITKKMLTIPVRSLPFILLALLCFQLANALVLSWPDIKSALTLYVITVVVIVLISFGVISINLQNHLLVDYFFQMDKYLLVPMVINTVFVVLLQLII